jgi:hypothetical protein
LQITNKINSYDTNLSRETVKVAQKSDLLTRTIKGSTKTPRPKEEDILIKIARMNDVQKRILKSYHWLILDLYEITDQFMLPVNTFL